MTQCMLSTKCTAAGRQYFVNVALKCVSPVPGDDSTCSLVTSAQDQRQTRRDQRHPGSRPCINVDRSRSPDHRNGYVCQLGLVCVQSDDRFDPGADVTHPRPGVQYRPSFAAVVANIDSHNAKYVARMEVQDPNVEMIQGLEDMSKASPIPA